MDQGPVHLSRNTEPQKEAAGQSGVGWLRGGENLQGPRLQSPFVVSKVHFTKVRSVSNVDLHVAVGVGDGVRDGLVLVLLSDSKLAHSTGGLSHAVRAMRETSAGFYTDTNWRSVPHNVVLTRSGDPPKIGRTATR